MIAALIAAAYTFTATATGVEKGTPLEFMFAGEGTDRDYETMFVLDKSVKAFCADLEKAGVPRGRPAEAKRCRLWPVGCTLTLAPALAEFVESDMPAGLPLGPIIYTGGTRTPEGAPRADGEMPLAALALYSLNQSPLLFNGIYEQGQVYGCHKAKVTLKKGERRTFTLTWNDQPLPKGVAVTLRPGRAAETLRQIKAAAEAGEIDLRVAFDDALTVAEATAFAEALAVVDSVRVKVNGRDEDGFFYRAFLPLVKWRERKERLTQPFEVTIGEEDKVIFIEEDWSGEGMDPKLTEKVITYAAMKDYPKVETVFFYAKGTTRIGRLKKALGQVPGTVINHYIFAE